MTKRIDLHTHSHFSDGSHSPAWLISQAKERNLAIALTDHNTVSGLPEFLAEKEVTSIFWVFVDESNTLTFPVDACEQFVKITGPKMVDCDNFADKTVS